MEWGGAALSVPPALPLPPSSLFHPVCKRTVLLHTVTAGERGADEDGTLLFFALYNRNDILFSFWHNSTRRRCEVSSENEAALGLYEMYLTMSFWFHCSWFDARAKDSPSVDGPRQLLKPLASQLASVWHHLAFDDA